jgi:NADPH2:quinone reductase
MSFEQAAALRSNTLTALYALHNRAGLRSGESVLVFGAAGGVGGAAIQVSKLLGAHVIAVASTAAKRVHALRLGADLVIDTEPAAWRDRLKALAAGRMPDVVIDPVCGPLFEPAFRSLVWNGRYLVVGFAAGAIPTLAANLPLLKGAALIGVDIRQFNLNEPDPPEMNRRQLRRWLVEGAIEPQVGEVFPFEAFRDALAHAAKGASGGKTVVRVG